MWGDMMNKKVLFAVLVSCLFAQNLWAAINWSETVSTNAISEDFEAYPVGKVDGTLSINVGTAGEVFLGQSVSEASGWDVVSGTPTNPLTIAVSTDEIQVYSYVRDNSLMGLTGGTIGLGALSFLFDLDHTELGLAILGANQGDVTFQFFDRTGASVGTAVVTLTVLHSDFTLTSDAGSFAGVTITNNDGAGITYDDLRLGEGAVVQPSAPALPIPTLSQWALILLSMLLVLMVFANRRRLF
jgi:hypothetical protein